MRPFDLVAMLEAYNEPMMIITDMSLSGMKSSARTLMETIACFNSSKVPYDLLCRNGSGGG
jgi:hypothetical protein